MPQPIFHIDIVRLRRYISDANNAHSLLMRNSTERRALGEVLGQLRIRQDIARRDSIGRPPVETAESRNEQRSGYLRSTDPEISALEDEHERTIIAAAHNEIKVVKEEIDRVERQMRRLEAEYEILNDRWEHAARLRDLVRNFALAHGISSDDMEI
ncbi:hypothetical protein [Rhizobium tumorigenes]|uniref:Uncharacterized protein n=1 Tax=Rhizobium tumorigenes TaxID=2041385 RepID=A0AAF1K6T8_9HYPH|nr:hypothetical protein [Rhizobium tumorigenes]WFR96875.1 hypothetical protein PR017_07110 [Rhizobium tumorigenes]